MFPRKPLLLGRGFWLGERTALTQLIGVQGLIRASCRTVSIDAPGAFSLGPLQRPVLFSREKRMGGWEHFPLGRKKARPFGRKIELGRALRGTLRPPQGLSLCAAYDAG